MYDIIIIGMGVSGITAGIYAKRANKNVLMFESYMPGGLINNLDRIENYPGFSNVTGTDLAMSLFKQVNDLDIPYKTEKIVKISVNSDSKIVYTEDNEYECKNLILAMGRKANLLGITDEDKLFGHGLSACATCDGNFYRGKDVAVIGQNMQAIEAVKYLSPIANKVYLIVKNDKLVVGEKIIDEIDNVKVLYDAKVTDIKLENSLIKSIVINEDFNVLVSGVFVYLGYSVNSDLVKDWGITNQFGYVLVNDNFETNIPGIYAIGDLIKKDIYQIVTGASDGARVITSILRK
jgi:thioredoxin reductase (NADPH)